MKAIYTLLVGCFCVGASLAQSDIASLEYFFDTDPGIGNGTLIDIHPDAEIINQSFNISTSGLTLGTHRLFIRSINIDGDASMYEHKTFRVYQIQDTNNTDITEVEYFFNTDPGFGNGTPIDIADTDSFDDALTISTSGLPIGTHRLFIRVKNTDDTYSMYEHKTFRVYQIQDTNNADITEVEYFFNTDPGFGNGTPIDIADTDSFDDALTISTSGLPIGTHRLFIRVKNTDDTYSMYEHKTFRIYQVQDTNNADITEVEYFFNTDPGLGNGIAIDIADTDNFDDALAITTSGLSIGTHRLFIRVKNADDTFSMYEHKTFRISKVQDVNNATITAAEYFIDVDPGFGNASPLTVSGDVLNEDIVVPTSGSIAQGDHYLHIRVLNADGTWSLYDRKLFEVDGTLGILSEEISEINIYPIPASNYVNLKTPNHIKIKSMRLIDMNGKVVMQLQNGIEKINVSQLQQGVYLIQITTENGSLSKRIIKN